MPERLILVTIPGPTAACVYNALPNVNLVIEENPESKFQFLNRRRRRLGLRRVLGQVLFQMTVVPWLKRKSRPRIGDIVEKYNLSTRPIPEHKILRVDSVNSDRARQLLQQSGAELVVLHGTRIVSQASLDSLPCPWVNLHAGITPRYRGTHGAYWALYEGLPQYCGVTLHRVDCGIDTGDILAQACFRPEPDDNFATYPWVQLGLGLEILRQFLDNPGPARVAAGPSGLYYHPTLAQYLKGWLRGVH